MVHLRRTYRLNMSETISTSVSAAAIFSAEEGCGRPPPNMLNDMAAVSVGTWMGDPEGRSISAEGTRQIVENEIDELQWSESMSY